MATAPARTSGAAPQSPASASKGASVVPFPIASRRKTSLGFQPPQVTMSSAGANVSLGIIEIPPTGFLRYVEVLVTGTTASNAATVVFAPDGPFNCISYINLTNASGDTIIVPVDGYMLYLMNKWGALSEDPPWSDPRSSLLYSATAGVGSGLGGSFQFGLRIPLEIDPETAFGAIPSMASNKSLQINLQIAPTSAVYTTAPTTPPTITVVGYQDYWAQPNGDNGRGLSQATQPDGNNSIMLWRLDSQSQTAGDKTVKINNVGNVIRMMLFVYRNASNARSDALIPALHQIILNNDVMLYKPDPLWVDDMSVAYGYTNATRDVAQGLDTGVRALHYFMASSGRVRTSDSRAQFLPTLDTTLLQYRASQFGSGMNTLQILTCEIKPTSVGALFQRT
jgi:hypothetical protein